MQAPELGMYGLQVWMVSVTASALGLTKIALWLRASSKNNGRMPPAGSDPGVLMAREAAKFETRVLGLTEKIVELTESAHARQDADRKIWGPGLEHLIKSHTQALDTLSKHTIKLDDHLKYSQQMWTEMVGSMYEMVERIGEMPCTRKQDDK